MDSRFTFVGLIAISLVACSQRPEPRLEPVGLPALPVAISDAEAVVPMVALEAWSARYDKAPASERERLISEGKQLALVRSDAMRRLLISNPQLAIERAMTPVARAALPEEIALHIERFVGGRGTLHVIGVLPNEGEPQLSTVDRFVTFEGRPGLIRAGVFGKRLAQATRQNIRLHGVELDGAIALTESGLRRLLPGEPWPDLPIDARGLCPVSRKPVDVGVAFHAADAVFTFCVPMHGEELAQVLSAEEDELTAPSAWTEGAKTLLFIRVDYSDDPGDPIAQATAQTLIDTSVNNYYSAASYGKTSISTTVTPTLRLPQTKATYASTQNYLGLRSDALAAAADAGFVPNTYNLDIVGFKSTFSGWAGRGYIGSRGTWLNGSFGLGVTAHELGHNYGVQHANRWNAPNDSIIGNGTTTEYGNPFDVMGASGSGGHFNAWFKRRFDWITTTETQVVTTSGTYRIHALESLIATGLHTLKVPRDGVRDYWVEFRTGFPANRGVSNGALINWGFQSNVQSQLLDMVPATSGFSDASLVIGRTFSDRVWGIHLTPIGKGGTTPESLDIVANLGDFPGNQAPTASVTASATSVAINAPVTLTVTASDPDGDPLAYFWEFDDGNFSIDNLPVQTKAWPSARQYQVRVTVSDRKGKTATAAILITVGTPTTFKLQGTVTAGGQPLYNARISDGTRFTTTLADGKYVLAGVPAGNVTVTATAFDYSFTRSFAAPLMVSADATGLDFAGTSVPGYAVSGSVTSAGVGVANVVISNGATSATTNATGDFSLANVPNGRQTLTATLPGWQFTASPANPFEVYGGAVIGRNFYASGVNLSGSISGVNAAPVVTDGTRSVTAVKSGANYVYSLNTVPNGTWNLVATLAGSTITPSNFTNPVTVAGANSNNLNFSGSATATFSVGGTVNTGGTPLPGVVVSDGTRSSTSDSLGRYAIGGVPAGSYTLTPTRAGYTFVPASLAVTVAAANLTGQNFTTTVVNAAPTVATAAAVSLTPTTGPAVTLTVLGADDGGEPALTYSWVCSGGVSPPTFSANGTNGAKSTTATFTRAGTYTCEATLTDAGGLTVKSQVTVQVTQALTQVVVTPATASVMTTATQSFVGQQRDQFGQAMFAGALTWTVSGGGTIATNGLFTAGATAGGPHTVTAAVAGKSGGAFVTVTGAGAPTIATAATATPNPVTGLTTLLAVLGADDAGEASLLYTWSAPTAPGPVTFSANGDNAAKSSTATFVAAGDYVLLVTATDTAGNVVSSSVNVKVNATPTTLQLQPAVANVQAGQTQQFTVGVEDQFGDALATQPAVSFAIGGGGTIDANGLFTAGATAGGPFTVTATSGALTATAQVFVGVSPDTTPPTVSLVAPIANARLNGPVLLQAAASDDVGVAKVEFFVDATRLGEATTAPFELSSDATAWGSGPHALTAKATDAAGNSTTSDAVPVVVDPSLPPDTTPPVVRITTPASGAQGAPNVGVTIEATDDVGVVRVTLELDGAQTEQWLQAPYAGQVTAAVGAHVLIATAVDGAGNLTRSEPIAFEVVEEGEAPPPPSKLEPVLGSSCGCSTGSGAEAFGALLLLAFARRRKVQPTEQT